MAASAGSAAKCPACGWQAGATFSPRRDSRYKTDIIIALMVLVALLLLWRLKNRQETLGAGGSRLATNIFGTIGLRLVQEFGGGESGGSRLAPPAAPASGTSVFATNNMGTHEPAAPDIARSNNPPGATAALVDDTLVTNVRVKSIIGRVDTEPTPSSPAAGIIAERLGAVGAKGGDIQFSLGWDNFNDLDLHCIDPRGVEIWFQNPRSGATGGILDHDANANEFVDNPVENIYWPSGGAPAGIYRVYVVYYANHGGLDPTAFTVRTIVRNQTNYFTGYLSSADVQQPCWICSIQYDPANPDPAKRRRFMNYGQTTPYPP